MQELTADWKPAGELLQQLLNVIEAAGKEKNQERTVVQSQLLPISEMRKSSERKPKMRLRLRGNNLLRRIALFPMKRG
jgi:hypothetical protein